MPRTRLIAALAAALLLLPAAAAAAPTGLTLEQAIGFALGHNPNVLAARAGADSAAAALAHNRSLELPLVSAQGQSILQRQSVNNAGAFAQFGLQPRGAEFSQNTTSLQGSQSVYNLSGTLQAKQAKYAYDAALQNLRGVREQTKLDVETAYYTLVQDVQLADLAASDEAYQRALLLIANANYAAGKVAGIDRLKAQVQLTSSQERRASADADAADARDNLVVLIGAPAGTPIDVDRTVPQPALPSLDLKALTEVALAQRPDVSSARDQLENAALAKGLVDAPNRPSILLTGAWGNQLSPTTNAQNFDLCVQNRPLGVPVSACAPGPSHYYTVGVTSTWTLPLVDWGSLHTARRSAQQSFDAQAAALDAARTRAVSEVGQSVRRVRVEDKNLALAGANAQLAKQTAQIAQVQYRVGIISQIDVTAAEQTYLQAARDLLAARVGYVLATEKLRLATGTLL